MSQPSVSTIVSGVIDDVRRRGDTALLALIKKFDRITLTAQQLVVGKKEFQAAYQHLPKETRRALAECAERIRFFHQHEKKRTPQSWNVVSRGVRLGQLIRPVDAVGVYVPGGRFSYPSTVLMTAIPARVAGVKKVVVATPPARLTDDILAACHLAGVDMLYRVGGPGAIAALAFGTTSIPRVDLIVGPGNAFVTEAKRQLFGQVGIDLLAGPSELVVIADDSAKAEWIAADMAAQAEHDPDSRSILVSLSPSLTKKVRAALPAPLKKQCDLYSESNFKKAMDRANRCAGEHVEVCVRHPQKVLAELRHGGAVFVNSTSPAVMGDYWAGPSHVLPTGTSARFASGLSVMTFLKRSSLIEISAPAFRQGARAARHVAEKEGLRFHAEALHIRTRS